MTSERRLPRGSDLMRYILAVLLPPVAVLFCGRPVQFLLNLVLTLLFWIPGMIHAMLVVNGYYADRRTDRIIRALDRVPAHG